MKEGATFERQERVFASHESRFAKYNFYIHSQHRLKKTISTHYRFVNSTNSFGIIISILAFRQVHHLQQSCIVVKRVGVVERVDTAIAREISHIVVVAEPFGGEAPRPQ